MATSSSSSLKLTPSTVPLLDSALTRHNPKAEKEHKQNFNDKQEGFENVYDNSMGHVKSDVTNDENGRIVTVDWATPAVVRSTVGRTKVKVSNGNLSGRKRERLTHHYHLSKLQKRLNKYYF